MATISMKCNECGGILETDQDREILFCPYCGSKEIFLESDDVKKARIKYKARKETELGKKELEVRSQENKNRTDIIMLIIVGVLLVVMMFIGNSHTHYF